MECIFFDNKCTKVNKGTTKDVLKKCGTDIQSAQQEP